MNRLASSPAHASPDPAAQRRSGRRRALAELWAAPLSGLGFFARAWAAIFVVEASLRVAGYRRTLRWIERVPGRRRRRRGPSVFLGERLVRGAYRAHLLRGGCLPRSLVQYLLHRRDGTAARFVIGVRRPRPNETRDGRIEAHAWVESAQAGDPGGAPVFSRWGRERPQTPRSGGALETFAPIHDSGDA
jgi:hypothetical protein